MPSLPQVGNEVACFCSTMFQNDASTSVTLRLMSLQGDNNGAAYKYYKSHEHQDRYNSSVAVMLREMQSEVNTGDPFEGRVHFDYSTNIIISLRFTQQMILIVASWLFTHGRSRSDPEL